jgi:ribonuclease III family protein
LTIPQRGVLELSNVTHELASARLRGLHEHMLPKSAIARLSPATLAYVGDAVFELYIRSYYLLPPQRLQSYHNVVVTRVRAETQAEYLSAWEPYLNEIEAEIARKGRNAARSCPKRLDPKIYQQATSFEALIGYLYLTNPQRLAELLEMLKLN